MASHSINRATLCSLAIAFYLCLLSYSSISIASASPYPSLQPMNDQLIEREPLVACSAVKGLHIECSPGGQKPKLNVLGGAKLPQESMKKTARNVQRRANDLMFERGLLSHFGKSLEELKVQELFEHELSLLGDQGTYDHLARRER
ncbi:hypothetical protein MMC15_000971 [Xylographa vitiligo]|nr:hypothetical protein [Xylographa vitiligo]